MRALAENLAARRQHSVPPPTSEAALASVPSARGHNLAIPRRGHVLTTVSEKYARPVRTAVEALTNGLRHEDCMNIYYSSIKRRIGEPGAWVVRSPRELVAWAAVSAWLTGFATGRVAVGAGLEEGTDWFFAGGPNGNLMSFVPQHALMQANEALASCRDPVGYRELLPYVLDPHGPGSRLSVRRDATTQPARDRKRAEGSFYTPADVAAYMVRRSLDEFRNEDSPPLVFDPACGTGVFLRAAVEALKEAFPDRSARVLSEQFVFGVDVDPLVLDAAAFILLSECLVECDGDDVSPLLIWHRLRLNLACVDTLTIDPIGCGARRNIELESDSPEALASGRLPAPDKTREFGERNPLSRLFAALPKAAFAVVGNPPYSTAGDRSDLATLGQLFATLGRKGGPGSEIYPLFVEQMVRLAPRGPAAGTLVLPLSMASNVRNQFAETRSFIEKTPGKWQFAFFDRQPHALFGEDVKTRNTILFWSRGEEAQETKIESGPLHKWRGDSRAAMFSSVRFTPIASTIRGGIPKVNGDLQARAFEALAERLDRFDTVWANLQRIPLTDVLENRRHTVFAGGTAYNFLNVFLNPPSGVLEGVAALSEHPLHAMDFATKEDAAAAFALLSSHLAFWWWHVTQDGFHVTARFLGSLPFGADALWGTSRAVLVERGETLWSLMRDDPIVSLNRGRSSLGYSPNGFNEVRHEIDNVLAEAAGLDPAFVIELQRFATHTVRAELRAVHDK